MHSARATRAATARVNLSPAIEAAGEPDVDQRRADKSGGLAAAPIAQENRERSRSPVDRLRLPRAREPTTEVKVDAYLNTCSCPLCPWWQRSVKVRSVHWTPTGFSCLHGSAAKLSLSLADSPILSWLVETAAPGLSLKLSALTCNHECLNGCA